MAHLPAPSRVVREDLARLRSEPTADLAPYLERLVRVALHGPREGALACLRLLGALAPVPAPPGLLAGLEGVRSPTRLLEVCTILLECGPEARDAVARLASQPGPRGRAALSALGRALFRPPLRASAARRLADLLAHPELPRKRKLLVADLLLDGAWLSAEKALREVAGDDPAWLRIQADLDGGLWGTEKIEDFTWDQTFPTRETAAWRGRMDRLAHAVEAEYQDRQEKLEARRQAHEERLAALRKLGRNDPCPCGSGRKLKKCCLEEARDPWLGSVATSPAFLAPFRVPPFEHPEAPAILEALQGAVPPAGSGPAVVWAAFSRDVALGRPLAPAVPRALERWGEDPLFRPQVVAPLMTALLESAAPEALPGWLEGMAACARPREIALLTQDCEKSEAIHADLVKALVRRGVTDLPTWRGAIVAAAAKGMRSPDLVQDLVRAADLFPQPDRGELLGLVGLPETSSPRSERRARTADPLEAELLDRVFEAVDRLDGRPEPGLLPLAELFRGWEHQLPTTPPPAPDSVEPWQVELRTRLEWVGQLLEPGGLLGEPAEEPAPRAE